MASRWCSSALPFVAGVLLVSASQVSAFVGVVSKGSCVSTTSPTLDGTSCAASGAWGFDEGARGSVLAGRVQRWDTGLAGTPEDVDASNPGDGSSGSEEDDAVWARAELPLSNDVQVQQATRAVWQVTGPS